MSEVIDAPVDASEPDAGPGPVDEVTLPEAETPAPSAWTPERILCLITTVVLVGGSTFFVLRSVHPDLIFKDTTPTGGDMGAHVWGPAYLRDHLLPSWRLSGWTMDWYSGFPMYRFYMVVPALAILWFDVVLPYGIAFKLVAVLGLVTLPVCAWAFGRLARFAFPIPELLAVAATIFLYDESFTIYGGNIASTMAGEFSFSIALSLAVLGFGLFARGLQDGGPRALTAIVVALSALSHGIVLMFVLGGVTLMALIWIDRRRFTYAWTTIGTAILLAGFWVVPFLFGHEYMTDMKYEPRPSGASDSFWDMFFPLPMFFDITFTALAVIGFVAMVVRRNLTGVWLGVMGLVLTAAVYVARDSLPIIGLLWNPRVLPFLYLVRYFLAAIAVAELARAAVRLTQLEAFARRVGRVGDGQELPEPPPADGGSTGRVTGAMTALSVGVVTMLVLGFHFQELPGARVATNAAGESEYRWGPFRTDYGDDGFVDGWSRWNFSGYEGKPAYGEYYQVVQAMKSLGEDPAYGCGRALWENNEANNKYGTTMALMLLPFWTDGCIGSSEGLFFEAAGTTPYHFLTAAAMSKQSSNPVRELRYTDNDASVGVRYLQELGIRYVMAFTPEAVAEADQQPELSNVAIAGPWHIYEVADAEVVLALDVQPVVVESRGGDQRERWLEVGTSWLQNPDDWAARPAADGPDSWQRVGVVVDETRRIGEPDGTGRKVDVVVPATPIETVELPEIAVSEVEVGDDSVSFSVDQVGVPVLVRVSHFPNWKVDGAEGPYRVAPNMMVVVPTSNEVRLHYGSTTTDYIAYLMTLLGIVACVLMWRRGPVRYDDVDEVPVAADVPGMDDPPDESR